MKKALQITLISIKVVNISEKINFYDHCGNTIKHVIENSINNYYSLLVLWL